MATQKSTIHLYYTHTHMHAHTQVMLVIQPQSVYRDLDFTS